jgi:hypothetical protein
MTHSLLQITEDDFDATYPLVTNHLDDEPCWPNGDGPGFLFRVFGEELAFVRSQDPRNVWTFVGCGQGKDYILSGCHDFRGVVGYFISTVPIPQGFEVKVAPLFNCY